MVLRSKSGRNEDTTEEEKPMKEIVKYDDCITKVPRTLIILKPVPLDSNQ